MAQKTNTMKVYLRKQKLRGLFLNLGLVKKILETTLINIVKNYLDSTHTQMGKKEINIDLESNLEKLEKFMLDQ